MRPLNLMALAIEQVPLVETAEEEEVPELRVPVRSTIAAIARQQAFGAIGSWLDCCGVASPKFPFIEVLIRTASKE
jgi:hypothetical protein